MAIHMKGFAAHGGRHRRQQDRAGEGGAAALEHAYRKAAVARAERDPQRSGEDSLAASGTRNRKAGARPPSAAICRRLNSAYFAPRGQASTAPQAFEASACSVAQSVSFDEAVRTMTRFASSIPAAASAGA